MPEVTVAAVLIDTVSIQKYIFAGNKLKENIGASRNVSNIYKEHLQSAVEEAVGRKISLTVWQEDPESLCMAEDFEADFEVGYIGGGNALLFFREKDQAEAFVRIWTKKLLIEVPGIQTAVAIDSDFDVVNFKSSIQRLFESLRENKNRYLPQTFLPKHGITADCPLSGLSAEIRDTYSNSKYVSSVVHAKLKSAADLTMEWLDEKKREKYIFTDKIDSLGQIEGNSYIAVVHIDGNSMGERFKNCQTLQETRKLSIQVKKFVDKAFARLLDHLIEIEPHLSENGFAVSKIGEKTVLRIRPMLVEGDDITFISDGRLGVYLAEKYLQLLAEVSNNEMSACAGVAITKTKYPFYRGYQLAEELCANAKKNARKMTGTSWLDFHLAYGGFSGSLDLVRSERYRTRDGSLTFGPYLISSDKENAKNIIHLISGIRLLKDPEQWPQNKVKDLRTVLTLGKDATEHFITESIRKGAMPVVPGGSYEKCGFDNGATPYHDMIELSEFYPVGLLQ